MFSLDWPLTVWIFLASVAATVCWRLALMLIRLVVRTLRRGYGPAGAEVGNIKSFPQGEAGQFESEESQVA